MPMQATATIPLFAAELTPHRSLGRQTIIVLIGLCAVFVALPVLALVLSLQWTMIAGLMAIDAVAIGTILVRALRTGKRREHITVWSDQIEWTATDNRGVKTLRRFNPRTVRLVLVRDTDEKTLAMRLRHGQEDVEVGSFLRADDKSSFAKALGTALRKARA